MQIRFPLRHLRSRSAAISATLGLACGLAAAAGPDIHYYVVTVDYTMTRLWVEASFSSTVDSVTARSKAAGKLLVDARDCGDSDQIRMRNRRMLLPPGGIDCMYYTVDLQRAAREERHNRSLSPGNIIASPALWLWRPELHNGTELRVRFRLPDNVRVSVPWELLDAERQEYRLGASPESAHAPAVFGNFDYLEIEVPGAVLRVSLLKAEDGMDADAMASWLRATATDISLAYGRFPNPSPQIVVIPVDVGRNRASSPVPFGQVIRDGGETVELLIDPRQPIQSFLDDWTATHEFSHLMLPYMDREQKWIAEGFAQYYQNVLLARAGLYDDATAWQKLYDGFERGRESRPELSPNEAAAGEVGSGLMKIYWSGAALALMADVRLRELSGGGETLDSVLGRLAECCLPSDRAWSGPELFAKLDSLSAYPVFTPLYRRHADTAGFPDIGPVFERLGLAVSNGKLRMKRHAELAGIRAAITETDAAAANRRQQLAARE